MDTCRRVGRTDGLEKGGSVTRGLEEEPEEEAEGRRQAKEAGLGGTARGGPCQACSPGDKGLSSVGCQGAAGMRGMGVAGRGRWGAGVCPAGLPSDPDVL